ncbi:hypothetical protein NFI96_004215 [Prochilodus magdalenae]|nr:hypothetical protein NFI96_004215 [Prochilodus magdalenae]
MILYVCVSLCLRVTIHTSVREMVQLVVQEINGVCSRLQSAAGQCVCGSESHAYPAQACSASSERRRAVCVRVRVPRVPGTGVCVRRGGVCVRDGAAGTLWAGDGDGGPRKVASGRFLPTDPPKPLDTRKTVRPVQTVRYRRTAEQQKVPVSTPTPSPHFFTHPRRGAQDRCKTLEFTASEGQPRSVIVGSALASGNVAEMRPSRGCKQAGFQEPHLARLCAVLLGGMWATSKCRMWPEFRPCQHHYQGENSLPRPQPNRGPDRGAALASLRSTYTLVSTLARVCLVLMSSSSSLPHSWVWLTDVIDGLRC